MPVPVESIHTRQTTEVTGQTTEVTEQVPPLVQSNVTDEHDSNPTLQQNVSEQLEEDDTTDDEDNPDNEYGETVQNLLNSLRRIPIILHFPTASITIGAIYVQNDSAILRYGNAWVVQNNAPAPLFSNEVDTINTVTSYAPTSAMHTIEDMPLPINSPENSEAPTTPVTESITPQVAETQEQNVVVEMQDNVVEDYIYSSYETSEGTIMPDDMTDIPEDSNN